MLVDLGVLFLTVVGIAITISCAQNLKMTPTTATVQTGQTATFSVSYTKNGGGNTTTSWTLTQSHSATSCSPGCGTVTNTAPLAGATSSVIYTAPAIVPTPSGVTLTFTYSDTDGTKSATAQITVIAGNSALTVTPQSTSVTAGSATTQQFTANVGSSPATSVTWALAQNGSTCTASACGSLNSTTANPVTYTPPTSGTATGTVTLTASTTSPAQNASTTITIQAPTLQSISVTPAAPSIAAGQTQQFTATGSYNNGQQQALTSGVTWTSSNTGVATIDSTGLALGRTAGTTSIGATLGTVSSANVILMVTAALQSSVPRYLFEVNGDGTISTYVVVPSTGQLRSVTYLPTTATAGQPVTAALHPNGMVLYTVQPVSVIQQTLVTYSVSAGGFLTQLASSTGSGGSLGQVLVDPLGRFLWAVTGSQIVSYPLDATTGAPGTQTAAANVANAKFIAADPSGKYLFSEDTSGNISAFTVASGGTLTALGTPPSAHPFSSNSLIVDPSGRYVYAMDASSINSIYGYAISGTGLASISGSPFLVPNNAGVDTQIVIDPTSSFLYAMDISSPTQPIDAFSIGSGGSLTSITETPTVPTGGGIQQITVDPSGKYLFAAYGAAHEVWTYSIAQPGTSGAGTLTLVNRMRLRSFNNLVDAQLLSAGTAAVQFTPQGLYVTNTASNSVAEFTITASTGALSEINGSPIATAGSNPKGIAVLPGGNFAYTADLGGPDITTYSITNNALSTSGNPLITGAGPVWLTTDLSGSFLYEVSEINSNLTGFSVSSGAIASTSVQATTDADPVFITNEPTGQFLYTANYNGGSINAFRISLPGGDLAAVGKGVLTAAQTTWVAVDPSGRFLYATNSSANALFEFVINAATGAITPNPANPFLPVGPASSSPGGSSVVVEPSGRYVYAANAVDNQIFAYQIDPNGGFLTEVHTNNANSEVADTGTTPVALAVDISGQYLYCVNSAGNNVNAYKINTDGTLTQVGTAAVPTGGTTPAGIAVTGSMQ